MLTTPFVICSAVAVLLLWLAWRTRRSIRRKLKRLLGFRWFTTLLIPLIAATPPVIIAMTDEKKNYWPTIFWQPIREFLKDHPPLVTFALLWPVGFLLLAYGGGWIRKKFIDLDELTTKEYGLILRTLDEVAGNKMVRFGNLAADTRSKTATVDAGAIFQTITQPTAQIIALLNGIYLVFLLDAETANPQAPGTISVTLAHMNKGQFEKFDGWVPQNRPPNSSQQHLRRRESAIHQAAKKRKPMIVKDIARELRKAPADQRFCPGAPGSSEEGSIIAYPVIHQATNDVPYVITVRSENPNHFTPRLKARYDVLLRPFSIRISIEHSLELLKHYHANHIG